VVTAAQTAGAERVVIHVPGRLDAPGLLASRAPRCSDPGVEHRLDEGVTPLRIGGHMAVASVVTPPALLVPSGQPICRCPEWHVLRLFGHGRHGVSFEAGDDRLVSPEIDSVCAVCGYGLLTMSRAELSRDFADSA
jgi:hypothetical protein